MTARSAINWHRARLSSLAALSVVLLGMLTDALSGNLATGWRRGHYQFWWFKALIAVGVAVAVAVVAWLLSREVKQHRFVEVEVTESDRKDFDRLIAGVSKPSDGVDLVHSGRQATVTGSGGQSVTFSCVHEACSEDTWGGWTPNVEQFFHVLSAVGNVPSVVLIATNQSSDIAPTLAALLRAWGYDAKVHNQLVGLDDPKAVTDVAQALLREKPERSTTVTVVDVTGGTKAMTVGLGLAALEAKAVMLYVDREHNATFRNLRQVPSEWARSGG
jgi:hypothetical protein